MERPASRPQPKPASRPEPRPEPRPVSRPETRPAPRPENRPVSRPPERPSVQKPSVQRPETRPAERPGRNPDRTPIDRPEQKPSPRPDGKPDFNRPDNRPDNRPGRDPDFNRPDRRPEANRPESRPNQRPNQRPDTRPSLERPGQNRPNTLPGMVTYPNRPDKGRPNRIDHNQINYNKYNNRNNIHIDKVNVGRRNVGLNRPATLPANRRPNWDNNRWGGNRGVWGNNNNVNIRINNNFRYNNNYSYRPNYWGARPWWGAGTCHTWHHGHWGYGYNSGYYRRHWYYHDDNDFASGFMWGIAVWSLGNMIYDMGYHTYRNPYPAPPVQNTYITYTQPVSVAAAAHPPGDEKTTELAETRSNEALERSRAAFRKGDYLAASKAVDEALAHTPADVTLHEYRALVFFALGKYQDAAGVLNPVLASGPGWSWDTMAGLYTSTTTYDGQLRALEAYVKRSPDKADARFLLGYHYMVCGHMESANAEFSRVVELQPADSISRQLRDLTASSIPDAGGSEATPPAPSMAPEPVQPEQLVGTWVSDRGADGKVTFTMTESGDYTWSFMNAGQSTELKGTYGLNDKGLLVLTGDDSQMVSAVEIKDGRMRFLLVGAPEGDPGLDFIKG